MPEGGSLGGVRGGSRKRVMNGAGWCFCWLWRWMSQMRSSAFVKSSSESTGER
jgi:hypothetical protein